MGNEIGYMEDRIEEIIGQQLHLEVRSFGVYDFEAVDVITRDGISYVLCQCTSQRDVGYLLKADDLGGGWWNIVDIRDDAEWEQIKSASRYDEYVSKLLR